jgi:hypothetical protein
MPLIKAAVAREQMIERTQRVRADREFAHDPSAAAAICPIAAPSRNRLDRPDSLSGSNATVRPPAKHFPQSFPGCRHRCSMQPDLLTILMR